MKIAYIICSLILDLFLLIMAVIAPIYITPGYYWWTAFFILILITNGASFKQRIDKWENQ